MSETHNHAGGCHCGRVRFEVAMAADKAVACNCSICSKTGSLFAFVPASAFHLVSGGDNLTSYRFNRQVIDHLFCKTCGIRSFARGKAPDGTDTVAVNVRCLDGIDLEGVAVTMFDGKSL